MENEFHLSIKNAQRKIGDVRDLFRNLTYDEKQCLEKEKILIEQQVNIYKQQQQQQQQLLQDDKKYQPFQRQYQREQQQQQQNTQVNRNSSHYNRKNNHNRYKMSDYYEDAGGNRNSHAKRESDSDDVINNIHQYKVDRTPSPPRVSPPQQPQQKQYQYYNASNYEQHVKSVYDRLNREANEDFGKYLDDDMDDDNDSDTNNNFYSSKNNTKNESKALPNQSESNTESKKLKSKKFKKFSFRKKKGSDSSDPKESTEQPKLPTYTDMCGWHTLELPPKAKEQFEKMKDEQSKGGIAGLKNKIKNFFTNDSSNDYYNNYGSYGYHQPSTKIKDDDDNDKFIEVDPDLHSYYVPRTIQDVQYGSSKIGFQAGQSYDHYYNQVNDLRSFDEDLRTNNLKYQSNHYVAVMDDEFNVQYTKSNKLKANRNNNDNSKVENPKKQNKFNKITEAIISKAKGFKT